MIGHSLIITWVSIVYFSILVKAQIECPADPGYYATPKRVVMRKAQYICRHGIPKGSNRGQMLSPLPDDIATIAGDLNIVRFWTNAKPCTKGPHRGYYCWNRGRDFLNPVIQSSTGNRMRHPSKRCLAYDVSEDKYYPRYCERQPLRGICAKGLTGHIPKVIYTVKNSNTDEVIPLALVQLSAAGQGQTVFEADGNGQFSYLMDCGGDVTNEIAVHPVEDTCHYEFDIALLDTNLAISYVTVWIEIPPGVSYSQNGELYVNGALAQTVEGLWEENGVMSYCAARGFYGYALDPSNDVVGDSWVYIFNPGGADEFTVEGASATVTGTLYWIIYCTNFNTGEIWVLNIITDVTNPHPCYP